MKSKILKFRCLNKNAKIPVYDHEDDAAFGVFSIEERVLRPMEIHIFETGISSQIPENCYVSIRDRSSMAAKGLHVLGGVIDAGYRGEWKIIIINLSNKNYKIKIGDKIAQGILQNSIRPIILKAKILDTTTRGINGFGSTGR